MNPSHFKQISITVSHKHTRKQRSSIEIGVPDFAHQIQLRDQRCDSISYTFSTVECAALLFVQLFCCCGRGHRRHRHISIERAYKYIYFLFLIENCVFVSSLTHLFSIATDKTQCIKQKHKKMVCCIAVCVLSHRELCVPVPPSRNLPPSTSGSLMERKLN